MTTALSIITSQLDAVAAADRARSDVGRKIMLDRPITLRGAGERRRRHFTPRWDRDGRLYIQSGRNKAYIGSAEVTNYDEVEIVTYKIDWSL